MRNGERHHRDIADIEAAAGAELLAPLQRDTLAGAVAGTPSILLVRCAGDVDRDLQPARQHAQAGHMVGVFVGDQDGIQLARILAAEHHATHQFAAGKAGVDQQAGPELETRVQLPLLPLARTVTDTAIIASITGGERRG